MSNALAMRRLALIVVTLLLAVPATALASGETVLKDCADDEELSRTYSQAEYKKAIASIPADLDEYTDCRAIIRKAQLRHASGTSKATKTGSGAAPKKKLSKAKSDKLAKALVRTSEEEGVRFKQGLVKPASLDSSSSIPTPLIVVLVLTLLGAAGASAIAIRRIVISRRNR